MALDQSHTNEQDLLIEFLDPRVIESAESSPPPNDCKMCSTAPFAHGGSCVTDGHIDAMNTDDLFHQIKLEISDADLLQDDFPHINDTQFHTQAVKNLDEDDQFFRFDNADYLYTHQSQQPDLAVSESGSPSGTVITRATSTNSLYAGYHIKLESLPLSILDEHDDMRKELAKIKFGNPDMNPCPSHVQVPDAASVLDFLPETMAKMQYSLDILDLPLHSRVETQTKLKFRFSPAPKELLLHVPQDLISKSKFCLAEPADNLPETLKKNMLFMDTYVMTSDLLQSCIVCPRCIKREQKRALRLKLIDSQGSEEVPKLKSEDTNRLLGNSQSQSAVNPWENDKMLKKAIIYNCKEIVSFPPPTGLPDGQSKLMNMSVRIICYCRHHKECEGFKLLVVVRDYLGEIKAKCVSSPIMIMDRKKTLSTNVRASTSSVTDKSPPGNMPSGGVTLNQSSASGGASAMCSNSTLDPSDLTNLHPLSPNSIDDLTSDSATRGLKRKKLSYDDLYNSTGFLPLSNSDTNASIHTAANSVLAGGNPKHSSSFLQLGPNLISAMNTPRAPASSQISPSLPVTMLQNDTAPCIQKIIPAQGPCRGGIEVTLLGYNFRPGLIVKFGAKNALATHCWSESTIVTYLPPCAHPGQVLVSFENELPSNSVAPPLHMVFTYTDDTDRQLIELALQIVGLKMNGKLEDAKNIAKRIVGTEKVNGSTDQTGAANSNTQCEDSTEIQDISSEGYQNSTGTLYQKWYDNAHRAVQDLTRSNLSTEEILINFLSLVDLPNCPIIIPNWNLANGQGQTLLHLSTLKNYTKLIAFLISHGTKIDVRDGQGLTPFFFALLSGHRSLMELLLSYKPNWNLKLSNDKYAQDYCDLNVLDVFERLEAREKATLDGTLSKKTSQNDAARSLNLLQKNKAPISNAFIPNSRRSSADEPLNRSLSVDSLNSINMSTYGRHVSRMMTESVSEEQNETRDCSSEFFTSSSGTSLSVIPTIPSLTSPFANDSDDFADSELDSDENENDESDYVDYDYDYEYDESVDDIDEVGHEIISANLDSRSSNDANNMSSAARQQKAHLGLWSKMKQAVFALGPDETTNLPSYDDLFPFGDGEIMPKLEMERALNLVGGPLDPQQLDQDVKSGQGLESSSLCKAEEDAGIASDSLEDLALSYINRPRKTVRNDKMLLFFWIPILFIITSMFMYVSITGYEVQVIEQFKEKSRNALGNVMVGNDRLARVFRKTTQVG